MKNINKKRKFKVYLCNSISLNNPNEIENDNPIFKLISSFDEVNYTKNNFKEDLFKFLYFNKRKIHEILYDSDEFITISSDIIKNNISYYFYLTLLLEDDPNIINYIFSIELIRDINKQIENENDNNKFKNIIISKLMIALINNYKEMMDYDEDKDGKELLIIENNILPKMINNINKLKDFNFNFDINKIKLYKIDNIIIDIINSLIKRGDLSDYEYSINIMEQLDIKNINITKYMYDKLYETLDINNYFIKKYIIYDIKDLFDEKKINFYFILIKYILKNQIYIYHIPLLLETRKNILKIIKTNFKEISRNKQNDNKFQYIFDFITDSKYYYNKYISCINQNEENNIKINNYTKTSQKNLIGNSTNFRTLKNKNLSTDDDEDDYITMKCENIINLYLNQYNCINFIKEISNGDFIIGAPNDNLCVYDKNIKFKNKINIKIKESKQNNISTEIYSNHNKTLKFMMIQNLEELNNSINKISKNSIELIACSKYGLNKCSMDFGINRINSINIINISCNGYLEVNNNYILYGEKGIFHFNKEPSNLNIRNLNDLYKYNKDKRNYKSGIILNNNIIALTSNKILPNGEDLIIFYDIKNQKIINYCKNYSFVNGINGLALLNIEKENKKILVCACKKYIKGQKNGILLIKPEVKENEKIIEKFIETEGFEINCFCQINQTSNKNNHKNIFFFAGGFDVEKRQGVIKLYKIVNKEEKVNDLELLEDIYYNNDEKEGFEGTINCIVQSKNNGKILVSCWDKKVYIYSEPNIDYYFDEEIF